MADINEFLQGLTKFGIERCGLNIGGRWQHGGEGMIVILRELSQSIIDQPAGADSSAHWADVSPVLSRKA